MTRKLELNQSSEYPFCLNKVLYAAQDFRWCKRDDGWHSGVLDGTLIHIRQVNGVLEYKSHTDADLDEMLHSYFRLDVDVDEIYDELASSDGRMRELVNDYPWLRVLRQPDPWECTISYICSATNNVDRISRIVEKLAENFGCEVQLNGDIRHTFPTWEMALCAGVGRLRELRMGLDRHCKIITAAERIRDDQLDLYKLAQQKASYDEAKRRLMECYGIGNKIADCICLFTLNKTEAFPVDVWVRRAVKGCSEPPTSSSYSDIVEWAQNRFGEYAGYANQFLFFGERQGDEPIVSTPCCES